MPAPKKATPQRKLPCVTTASVTHAAVRAGLAFDKSSSGPAIDPGLLYTVYAKDGSGYGKSVGVWHEGNGAVAEVLCIGVVAATLDPVLAICTDLPTSARTDIARVRRWAVAAEQTIATRNGAVVKLVSSGLLFVACRDPFFPTARPGLKAQVQIWVQPASGSRFTDAFCR